MKDGRLDSIEFARFLLKRATDKGIAINMTKLQKLIYICDGLMLANDANYINELAKALPYGPVYPRVYKWYLNIIEKKLPLGNVATEDMDFINQQQIQQIVDLVLDKFSNWSALDLTNWSHQKNSPWDITVKLNDGKMGGLIAKESMAIYFKGLIR